MADGVRAVLQRRRFNVLPNDGRLSDSGFAQQYQAWGVVDFRENENIWVELLAITAVRINQVSILAKVDLAADRAPKAAPVVHGRP